MNLAGRENISLLRKMGINAGTFLELEISEAGPKKKHG
jgi:hypothetical protein